MIAAIISHTIQRQGREVRLGVEGTAQRTGGVWSLTLTRQPEQHEPLAIKRIPFEERALNAAERLAIFAALDKAATPFEVRQ